MNKLVILPAETDEVLAEVELTDDELASLRRQAEEKALSFEDLIIKILSGALKKD